MINCSFLDSDLYLTSVNMQQRRVGYSRMNCMFFNGGLHLTRADVQQCRVFHHKLEFLWLEADI